MTKSIRTARPAPLVCALLLLLLTTPRAAAAYDNDTHFWLTYYLAVEAGYTETQAAQIASANIGVDFDKDTEPLLPWNFDSPNDLRHPLEHFQHRRAAFHALPWATDVRGGEWWNPTKIEDGSDHAKKAEDLVNLRKEALWQGTLKEMENPGVFLHYLQDTFSHEGFTSYVGHAGYSYVDFLASDRKNATEMALVTFKYLLAFRAALEGKEFPDMQRPESFRLGDEQVLKIEQVVKVFCEVNPAPGGIKGNDLLKRWENSDAKAKRAYRLPSNPISYARLLLRIKSEGPAPNSARARRVVQKFLGHDECRLPYVWLYDFDGSGKVAKGHRATEALVYIPYRSKKRFFTGGDEEKNTRKRKAKVNAGWRGMPYSLKEDGNSPADPFGCN